MSTAISITDTGKRVVGGSVEFTQVNSGSAIALPGFNLIGEFTVNTTNNVSLRQDSAGDYLTFKPNEIAAVQAPRFTLRGLVPATSTSLIQQIVLLARSKGVKTLSGGLGLLTALPEASGGAINVIIKNISFTESETNDKTNVAFSINLEQVQ